MGTYEGNEDADFFERVLSGAGCEIVFSDPAIIRCFNNIKRYGHELYVHSVNVAFLSMLMGYKLYKDKKDRMNLFTAGLLHDYGKLYIAKGILNKPDILTQEERKTIELHSIVGYFYLNQGANLPEEVLTAILDHHEKIDGTGYGQHKENREISDFAKIIMIADVYDAMVSDRCYRKKLNRNIVYEYLSNQAGKHFDKDLVQTFIELTHPLELEVLEEKFRCYLNIYLKKFAVHIS